MTRHQGILNRIDNNNHPTKITPPLTIAYGILKTIHTIKIKVRCIGQRTVLIIDQQTMAGGCKARSSQGIAIHITVVGQQSGRYRDDDGEIFVGHQNHIAARDRGILNSSNRDGHGFCIHLNATLTRTTLIVGLHQQAIIAKKIGVPQIGKAVDGTIDIPQRTPKNQGTLTIAATGQG